MTAELIAAQRAEDAGRAGDANGHGGSASDSGGEPKPWRSSPSRPREVMPAEPYEGADGLVPAGTEVRSAGTGERADDEQTDPGAPPIDEGADDIASLRSRLARTAAKKKSRTSMDRPRSS
jgi:hypothetical protein